MLPRQHQGSNGAEEGKEIEWLSVIIIVCTLPAAMCITQSLNEMSLWWVSEMDAIALKNRGCLFFFFFQKGISFISLFTHLVVGSSWLEEMHAWYLNDQHPKYSQVNVALNVSVGALCYTKLIQSNEHKFKFRNNACPCYTDIMSQCLVFLNNYLLIKPSSKNNFRHRYDYCLHFLYIFVTFKYH